MRVSKIDSDGDWTFGKGRANYISDSQAIAQNVVTRLRSFSGDWFLNTDHGENWFFIFGNFGTESIFFRTVERTVLQTDGVVSLDNLEILSQNEREIRIKILYTDVYGIQNNPEIGILA